MIDAFLDQHYLLVEDGVTREVWLRLQGVGRGRRRARGMLVRDGVEEARYGSSAWFMRTIQSVRQARKRMLEEQRELDERAAALAEREQELEDLRQELEAERAELGQPQQPGLAGDVLDTDDEIEAARAEMGAASADEGGDEDDGFELAEVAEEPEEPAPPSPAPAAPVPDPFVNPVPGPSGTGAGKRPRSSDSDEDWGPSPPKKLRGASSDDDTMRTADLGDVSAATFEPDGSSVYTDAPSGLAVGMESDGEGSGDEPDGCEAEEAPTEAPSGAAVDAPPAAQPEGEPPQLLQGPALPRMLRGASSNDDTMYTAESGDVSAGTFEPDGSSVYVDAPSDLVVDMESDGEGSGHEPDGGEVEDASIEAPLGAAVDAPPAAQPEGEPPQHPQGHLPIVRCTREVARRALFLLFLSAFFFFE